MVRVQERLKAERERALLAKLAGNNKKTAIKLLQKMVMAWMGTSLRGLTFAWRVNWQDEKAAAEEFARACALKVI